MAYLKWVQYGCYTPELLVSLWQSLYSRKAMKEVPSDLLEARTIDMCQVVGKANMNIVELLHEVTGDPIESQVNRRDETYMRRSVELLIWCQS